MAVDDDRGLALEDHVECRPGDPLAEDTRPLRVDLLLEHVRDPVELRGRQVREQREAGDLVDDLIAAGHRSGIPPTSAVNRILPPG